MTALVKLHENKRHHEADGGPLQTPDEHIKHPCNTLAREPRASNVCVWSLIPVFWLPRLRSQHGARLPRTGVRKHNKVFVLADTSDLRLGPASSQLALQA